MKQKILIIVGTRPEAIKMAPVYRALKGETGLFSVEVLSSGQHNELLDQAFDVFDWKPDHVLSLTRTSHDISELYALLFSQLNEAFKTLKPNFVLVHGDTATTAVASMVAFLHRIRVAHVEAGLRSFTKEEPWPEEINRKIADMVADVYFAPTQLAKKNLLLEGVKEKDIVVTGNTVVDALLYMSGKIETNSVLARQLNEEFSFLDSRKKLILMTGHRRENFGKNLSNVFAALRKITLETGCEVIFPVHPNQKLQAEIDRSFLDTPHIHVLPALSYPKFVYLMKRCDLIISDSGGVQEEAPTFRKQVLITRNVTERPEGVASGFLEIVGCDADKIVARAKAILANSATIHATNPYGDGRAAERIRKTLVERLAPAGTVIDDVRAYAGRKKQTREAPLEVTAG